MAHGRGFAALAAVFFMLAVALVPVTGVLAQSQSVILKPMPFSPGSKFGMRMHPIQKVMKLHGGQDYPIPIGTNVPYEGNYQGCSPRGSAGNMATVANACGVTQIFMHLNNCSSGKITSGNTGGSTGPHLHYEIHINGTKVDPIKAFNKDLCKEDVRKELLEDAKNNGSGGGGGGASANSNSPAPPAVSGGSSTYVPNGGKDPSTGIVNNNAGYYYVETPDGRVYTEVEVKADENEYPVMNETTQDVMPTTTTGNEVTGCATDTWKAMVNMAVLQTRREVVINGRYIAKGDTVMAYSCFEESIKKTGEKLGPVFSETKRWVNRQIDIEGKTVTVNKELGESSLDGAVTNAAIAAFQMHARTSFPHDVLGGTRGGSAGGGGGGDEGMGQDGLPCGTMNAVWQTAKCTNAKDSPLFPTFAELINDDPRKYPQNMQCKNTGITQGMIDLAANKSVKFDKVETHFDKLLPESNTCAAPVRTGVTVIRTSGTSRIATTVQYPDGLCLSPGCSYQNKGGSGEGKCEIEGP